MTSRRTFLATVTGALLAAPLAAWAQQSGKIYRIGFVWDSPAVWPHALEAFRQGLRDLGWVLSSTTPFRRLSRNARAQFWFFQPRFSWAAQSSSLSSH